MSGSVPARVLVIMAHPNPTRYYFGDTYVNHPDHRAAGELTLAAVSPAARNPL